MSTGTDPIGDDELIYRRIPASQNWYDATEKRIDPLAFGPHKERDATGLSFARACFKSSEEAARGVPGKSYYVAQLRVGDLRKHGIEVVSRPIDGDTGHSEAPDLNSASRKDDATLERQRLLTKLVQCVHGPYATPPMA